jgi:CDP-4-dehydro-6-deoxyglucose reductase
LDYPPVLSRSDVDWGGRLGYVQGVVVEDIQDYTDVEVYACGSLSMIESAKEVLMKKGLLEKYFYADAFVSS